MSFANLRKELMSGKSIYDLNLRVTFYARVSSEKENQLNSLENQKFYYENKIKSVSNWTYIEGYVDEGISGTSTKKREDFLNMIEDSKKDKFDLILTKEISRFARDTLDSIKYTRELLERNVGVYFETDNINTILPDSELRLAIMASIAQDEVRKLSERVRFGLKRSVEKNRVLGNNNIRGYVKDKGKLVIDEKEAEVVRKLFELYATGKYGFEKISHILYENGYKTSNNTRISPTNLKRCLVNPKYKGYYCSNTTSKLDYRSSKQVRNDRKDWIVKKCDDESIVPPIVSEELWNKANEIFEKRSKKFYENNPDKSKFSNRYGFSGKLICSEHQTNFIRSAGPKRKCRPVWVCARYDNGGVKVCASPILLEEELYEIIKSVFSKFEMNKNKIINKLLNIYQKNNLDLKINNEYTNLEKKMQNVNNKKEKLLNLNLNSYIDDEEFKERNDKLNIELNNLKEKVKENEQKKEEMKNFDKYIENLKKVIVDELDLSKRENLDLYLELLVDKIIVTKIDNNRKNVKLQIYFKFDEIDEINFKLGFLKAQKNSPKKCLLTGDNESYDFTFNNGTNRCRCSFI